MRRLTLLLTPLVLLACGDGITAPEFDTPTADFSHTDNGPEFGLIGHWALDGDGQDMGPNGLHGTVLGALPTMDQHGTENAAMAMADGGHIAVPDNPLLDVAGDFTMSFWLRTPGPGASTNFIVGKGRDVYDNYAFYRTGGSDEVRFYVRDGQYDPKIAEVSAAVPADEWHHLAAVVANGVSVTLYLDGQLVSESLMSKLFVSNNDHPLVFGRHYVTPEGRADNFPFPFTGDLDDVRLYNRVLTADEIGEMLLNDPPPDPQTRPRPRPRSPGSSGQRSGIQGRLQEGRLGELRLPQPGPVRPLRGDRQGQPLTPVRLAP